MLRRQVRGNSVEKYLMFSRLTEHQCCWAGRDDGPDVGQRGQHPEHVRAHLQRVGRAGSVRRHRFDIKNDINIFIVAGC